MLPDRLCAQLGASTDRDPLVPVSIIPLALVCIIHIPAFRADRAVNGLVLDFEQLRELNDAAGE